MFDELYACSGHPSIPCEQLLRALLLEHLDYNMLYRWFVGLGADDLIWHHTSFGKKSRATVEREGAVLFLEKLLGMEEVKPLLSSDRFFVGGTLCSPGHPRLPQVCGWPARRDQDDSTKGYDSKGFLAFMR